MAWVFPTQLFAPQSLQPRLLGAAVSGGVAISGDAQFAEFSGGGRWVVDFGESTLWTPSKVKAMRALSAAADSGATQILVPLADRRHQPLINPYAGADTFGRLIWDESTWTWAEVDAVVSADAALGETELSFTFTAPKAIEGGEHFSVEHPAWGSRLYRITRVKSGGLGSGDPTVVDFRPPLREAIAAADTVQLNFESPRCLMRVEGDLEPTVEMLKFGKLPSARFVEAAKPPEEA